MVCSDFQFEIVSTFYSHSAPFVNGSFFYTELTFCHADKKWINQTSIGWLCIIYSFIIINYHFITREKYHLQCLCTIKCFSLRNTLQEKTFRMSVKMLELSSFKTYDLFIIRFWWVEIRISQASDFVWRQGTWDTIYAQEMNARLVPASTHMGRMYAKSYVPNVKNKNITIFVLCVISRFMWNQNYIWSVSVKSDWSVDRITSHLGKMNILLIR